MAKQIFSRDPLIWLHYVILLAVLVGAFFLGDLIFSNFSNWKWYWMSAWFFPFLAVGDQLIHYIMGVD